MRTYCIMNIISIIAASKLPFLANKNAELAGSSQ